MPPAQENFLAALKEPEAILSSRTMAGLIIALGRLEEYDPLEPSKIRDRETAAPAPSREDVRARFDQLVRVQLRGLMKRWEALGRKEEWQGRVDGAFEAREKYKSELEEVRKAKLSEEGNSDADKPKSRGLDAADSSSDGETEVEVPSLSRAIELLPFRPVTMLFL